MVEQTSRRFRVRHACACLLALAVTAAAIRALGAQAPQPRRAPKLIVLLTVDQFRGDYAEKFQHQWTRGLHRLITQGAWFRQADYPYFNTVTCSGHASISTGAVPAVHGMILNNWWDRDARKVVNCTDDESVKTISYGKPVTTVGKSAARLRTTTLADELRAQLYPAPRIVAFSLKARSAVTLSGRRPYAVAWFDDSGTWVTSTAFAQAPIPEVAAFIAHNPVENDFGKVWDRALPIDQYLYEDPAVGVRAPKGRMTCSFPHALKAAASTPDAVFYDRWQSSPYADEYLARLALDVAEHLKLGTAASTDMIAISFAALDKVGHDFGPNSHEIQDILIRLDRTLGELLAGLDRLAGVGEYTVALTADHGVAPIPERLQTGGFDAGRIRPAEVVDQVEQALAKAFGPGKYVEYFDHTDIYLAPGVYEKLRAQRSAMQSVRASLASLHGILAVYTRDELVANHFEDDPMGRRLARSYDRERSGDLIVMVRPYWIIQANGTTHGTGYGYDTHVPVLFLGKGIARGEFRAPAAPTDVAPTLAFLTGVTLPRTSGRVLVEALTNSPPIRAAASAGGKSY